MAGNSTLNQDQIFSGSNLAMRRFLTVTLSLPIRPAILSPFKCFGKDRPDAPIEPELSIGCAVRVDSPTPLKPWRFTTPWKPFTLGSTYRSDFVSFWRKLHQWRWYHPKLLKFPKSETQPPFFWVWFCFWSDHHLIWGVLLFCLTKANCKEL